MKKINYILISVLIFVSCSNNEYVLIPKGDIKSAFILNSSSTFKGYYYDGTKEGFHFFHSKWDITKDKYFKLEQGTIKIFTPFKLGSNSTRITLLNKESDDLFGENEFYNLYKYQ